VHISGLVSNKADADVVRVVQVAALALVALGLWVLVSGVQEFNKALRTQRWVKVNGEVLSSGITTRSSIRTDHLEDAQGRHVDESGEARYNMIVVYGYVFEGKHYSNNRIRLDRVKVAPEKEVERRATVYHTGAMVGVYVNPYKPEESVLEREESGVALGMILLGMMSALAGIWAVVSLPAMIMLYMLNNEDSKSF